MTERKMRIVAVSDVNGLPEHLGAWNDLAAQASEANVFYEPWMLIPALRHLGEGEGVEVLFVYGGTELHGVFPLQRRKVYRRAPLRHLQLWQHRHCYLCTPLLRAGKEDLVVGALADWLSGNRPFSGAMVWNWVGKDGPSWRALDQVIRTRGWIATCQSFQRATFVKKQPDAKAYLEEAISGKHRRDLARTEKRLAEQGDLSWGVLPAEGDCGAWTDEFLKVEASGWKGRAGSALKCSAGDEAFFREVVRGGFDAGKAMLVSSRLNGRPLAMKCQFLTGQTGFAFKIAFDEEFSKSRPGLLLKVWEISELFKTPLRMVDSCAEEGHSLLDRVWTGRREIASIAVATRPLYAAMVFRMIPKLAQAWKKRRQAKEAEAKEAPAES